MISTKDRRSPKTIWAYAYQILPPQTERRLRGIKALLEHEHGDAQRVARLWTGQVVREPLMTHILVVSDGPAQDREVNRKLEAELARLSAGFALTAPMRVLDADPV